MAKAKPTPFGTNEPKPIDSAPLPPQVDGNFEVSASGIITGTGRVTFEKLWGPRPTNEALRAQGYTPRQITVIKGEWDDSYEHFLEAGLPPEMTEAQYVQAARVYGSDQPWATTGLPQIAAVQHVSRKSGRGEKRWIAKFPDAYTPDADKDPVPYWEGPAAVIKSEDGPTAFPVLNPHNAISTFQLYLIGLGVGIPTENLHPWVKPQVFED
jgi:hypothetical protein